MTFCAGFVANFFSIVAIREGFVAIFYSIVATCPGLVAICAGSVAILRGCPLLLVDSTYDHEHLAPETGQQREPMLTYRRKKIEICAYAGRLSWTVIKFYTFFTCKKGRRRPLRLWQCLHDQYRVEQSDLSPYHLKLDSRQILSFLAKKQKHC